MDDRQHSRLKRYIGWDEEHAGRLNRLTNRGYNVHHHRFPEHGPDCDDLLTWLRARWFLEIEVSSDTRLVAYPYRVTVRDSGVHFQSAWHTTLIASLAETVLFLGAELERTG